jgi:hypothetical protein
MVLLGTVFPVGALAQQHPTFTVRHSTDWSDSRANGECTIRVVIDHQVNVELRWDRIALQTLAGQPGRDNGSECNAPLPQGPVSNVDFQKLSGPGEAQLIQQPSADNNWAAVVRIFDPDSGASTYAFRLTWTRDAASSQYPGSSGGRTVRGRNNLQRLCRNALADRVLQEWQARVVNYGRRIGNNAQSNEQWAYGNTTNIEGRARISNGKERREIQYNCMVNLSNNTVQNLNYQFLDSTFSGEADRSSAVGMNNVISVCQNEIRERVSNRHGNADVNFRDISRKWWEGNNQRVNGRATVGAGGREAQIEYNCTASGSQISWADFRIVSGSLPRSSFR